MQRPRAELGAYVCKVEADEGIAIIPSFGLAACRNRQVVMSPLVDPVVSMEFHQITQRGRNLPEGADEFLAFLKTNVSGWRKACWRGLVRIPVEGPSTESSASVAEGQAR